MAKLGRTLWVALFLLHAPAFLKAWRAMGGPHPSEAQIVGCLWLTAAMCLFALKVLNVPWLRFRTDRRSRLAIIVAILLIHAGPLGVPADGLLSPSDVPLISTLLLAAGLDRVQQWFKDAVRPPAGRAAPQSGLREFTASGFVRLVWLAPLIVRAPRPPPSLR